MSVLAIADNNEKRQGSLIDHLKVISPEDIPALEPEVVVLMSDRANEMLEQLMQMGCPRNRIMHYRELIGRYGTVRKVQSCRGRRQVVLLLAGS